MKLQPEHTVFLFPGQGSQSIGMGRALAETFPFARDLFLQADDLLHFSLSKLAWEGPEDELNDTINTQPALLVHSVAALRVFQEQFPGFTPIFVAGHSMGEISALVAAGSLTYLEALELARTRGRLMKEAGERSPGGMAAIIGLDIPTLEQVCNQANQEIADANETVQVANDNCPGQVVISGSTAAVERAMLLATQAGARRAVPLAVSIAAHSRLMTHAQQGFSHAVLKTPLLDPGVPLIGNVTAQPLRTTEAIRTDLQDQLTHRVRWTETIQFMISKGATTFLELGNGSVLAGLLKRIDRQANAIFLGSPEDFQKLPASGTE